MALPRLGGGGFPLNLNGAFASQLPLPGPQTAASTQFTAGALQASNAVTLPAGGVYYLPAGTYYVSPGPVTSLQWLDPVSQIWRTINATPWAGGFNVDADGGNYRIANLSGCPIGALITNAGSGYTNGVGTTATGLTITPSAGGSVWVPVVGGVNNSTVTITAGGANYSFAPLIVCSPPAPGGIQMTATCTVSAGAINAVTVTNQGAGYPAPATLTVIPDYRDTTGSGGVLTAGALVSSGALAAMYPSGAQNAAFNAGVGGHGLPQTAVPTFTFAPASTTAATCLMNFVVTGLTVTGGGTAVPAGSFLLVNNGVPTGTRASNVAGPIADLGLVQERLGIVQLNISGGVVQGSGNIVVDPGFGFMAVPGVGLVSSSGVAPTGGINITPTVGGISDTSWVQPF